MAAERVQKILARAGIASRRRSEDLITEGLVTINGKLAKLGDKADFGKDAIKVRGKLLRGVEPLTYLAFNKPRGVITSLGDPEGRPSLTGYLGTVTARVYPIGRLDFNSEGLLLLTNDGDFAEKLSKRDDIPRVYRVKVKGHPDFEMLKRLERGIRIDRKMIKPHSVKLVEEYQNKASVEIVIMDSGVADLKAMFDMKGFLVERMIRVAIGHLTLKGLLPGTFRYLKPSQVQALLEQPELGLKRLAEESRPIVKPKAEREREAELERAKSPTRVVVIRPVTGSGAGAGAGRGSRGGDAKARGAGAPARRGERRPSFNKRRGSSSGTSLGGFGDGERKSKIIVKPVKKSRPFSR